MNKTLSKAIMQRSKLRKLLLKRRTDQNRNNYVKQIMLIMLSKGIYVLHFCEKVKESFLGV